MGIGYAIQISRLKIDLRTICEAGTRNDEQSCDGQSDREHVMFGFHGGNSFNDSELWVRFIQGSSNQPCGQEPTEGTSFLGSGVNPLEKETLLTTDCHRSWLGQGLQTLFLVMERTTIVSRGNG